jgi:hypothetical protein
MHRFERSGRGYVHWLAVIGQEGDIFSRRRVERHIGSKREFEVGGYIDVAIKEAVTYGLSSTQVRRCDEELGVSNL